MIENGFDSTLPTDRLLISTSHSIHGYIRICTLIFWTQFKLNFGKEPKLNLEKNLNEI